MKVYIKRSENYRRERALVLGVNVPEIVTAEINPADLTETTRRAILTWWKGEYPKEFTAFDIANTGKIHTWSGFGGLDDILADVEPEGITPEHIEAHVLDIIRQSEETTKQHAEATARRTTEREAEELAKRVHETQEREREARKLGQLADAVARFGTESQKERWNAGVLPHREALDLIWLDAMKPVISAGLYPDDGTKYHLGESITSANESEKRTLDDEEWATVKEIRAALGEEWEYSYWKEYGYDEDGEEVVEAVICRVEKRIGEYDFKAEFVLS